MVAPVAVVLTFCRSPVDEPDAVLDAVLLPTSGLPIEVYDNGPRFVFVEVSDAATLSAALRELAVRAHRLVRFADELRSQPASETDPGFRFNLEQELFELRSELGRLERRLNAQNLSGLVSYVSALRQRVADALA